MAGKILKAGSLSDTLAAVTESMDSGSYGQFDMNLNVFEGLEAVEKVKYIQMSNNASYEAMDGTMKLEAALMVSMAEEADETDSDDSSSSGEKQGFWAKVWAKIKAFFKSIWNFITFKGKSQKEKLSKVIDKVKTKMSTKNISGSDMDKVYDRNGVKGQDYSGLINALKALSSKIDEWNRETLSKLTAAINDIEDVSKKYTKNHESSKQNDYDNPATKLTAQGNDINNECKKLNQYIDKEIDKLSDALSKDDLPAPTSVYSVKTKIESDSTGIKTKIDKFAADVKSNS